LATGTSPSFTECSPACPANDVDEQRDLPTGPELREARYEALLSHATDLISILGPNGELLYQSPAGENLFGYDRDALLGTSVFELLHPDDYDKGLAAFRAVLENPSEQTTVEIRFRRGDGLWAVGECTTTNMLHDPVVAGLVINTRDVTERARVTAALSDSESRFRAVFEGSADAMLLTDDEFVVIEANRAACQLIGCEREDLVGQRADVIGGLPLAEAEQGWREMMAADGRLEAEWPLVRADGERRVVEARATANVLPGEHLSILRDVTDRGMLEQQLRQAQKMEAVGRLAGGVAHDFNNLLTAISGYAALAGTAENGADVREYSAQILRAARRATDLTRQLLAFSRQQTLHPKVVDVNDLVREATPMLRSLVGTHIDFEVRADPALRRVTVDPGNLEMALMNLVLNAAHAMPRRGKLTVSTENVRSGERDLVALKVTDTGHGMDEETVRRAFEPFFTTKGASIGTGLGLATVHGIAIQSGGDAQIESRPGHGTTVTVCLPATDELPRPTVARDPAPGPAGGSVLVVDDDNMVRDVIATMLESSGYAVTTAETPEEAVDLFTNGLRPDVVVSDVVMPGIGGPELATRLRAIAPGTQFVLMSGYVEHALLGEDLSFAVIRVDKPFSSDELGDAVRDARQLDTTG
jgi:two-component system cell cycle sensor histidine kinase/response regulator CckA